MDETSEVKPARLYIFSLKEIFILHAFLDQIVNNHHSFPGGSISICCAVKEWTMFSGRPSNIWDAHVG